MNVRSVFCTTFLFTYLAFSNKSNAQTDTAFWFAAPDINQNHNELPLTAYPPAATVCYFLTLKKETI